MHSYRVLGIVALSAIVIAVMCFTVVDISIDSVNGCLAARTVCREHEVPSSAIAYAILGAASLLASIPFAAGWVVGVHRRPEPEHRVTRPALGTPRILEEDL
jgi:hypothetical protein